MANYGRRNADSITMTITEFAAPGAMDWIAVSGMLRVCALVEVGDQLLCGGNWGMG